MSPDVSSDASECGEYSGFNNVHTCSVRIMLLSQLCELSVESVNSNAYLVFYLSLVALSQIFFSTLLRSTVSCTDAVRFFSIVLIPTAKETRN